MKFQKFREYLNSKGNIIEKPKVGSLDDVDVPNNTKPPKHITKGKNWKIDSKTVDSVKPYRPTETTPMQKVEKGLCNKGSIKPEIADLSKGNSKNFSGGFDKKGWEKTKSESFVDKIKNMDLSEFTQHMIKECGCDTSELDDEIPMVTSYSAGKFHPYPPEAIKYVASLSNKNDRILDSFIHEFKRNGGLKKLLKAVFDSHPESYDDFTSLLDDEEGESDRIGSLVKSMDGNYNNLMSSMFESVGPPVGFDDEESSEDEEMPEDGEEDSLDDEPSEDMPEDDEENPDEDSEDENPFGNENPSEDEDPFGGEEENPDDTSEEVPPMDDEENQKRPSMPPMPPKRKRKFKKKPVYGKFLEKMMEKEGMSRWMQKFMRS